MFEKVKQLIVLHLLWTPQGKRLPETGWNSGQAPCRVQV